MITKEELIQDCIIAAINALRRENDTELAMHALKIANSIIDHVDGRVFSQAEAEQILQSRDKQRKIWK